MYNFVSSNSFHIVPLNLASGILDQLKLFKGFDGCGTFFFTAGSTFRGSLGGGIGGPHGGGGGPGGQAEEEVVPRVVVVEEL